MGSFWAFGRPLSPGCVHLAIYCIRAAVHSSPAEARRFATSASLASPVPVRVR